MTKQGRCLEVQIGNVLLIQETEMKSVLSCQDLNREKRKRFSARLHFFPSPTLEERFFARDRLFPTMLTDAVSSLQTKPVAPFTDSLAAKKIQEGMLRMCHPFHEQLFQPRCGSAARRTAHLACLALTIPFLPSGKGTGTGGRHLKEGTRCHKIIDGSRGTEGRKMAGWAVHF